MLFIFFKCQHSSFLLQLFPAAPAIQSVITYWVLSFQSFLKGWIKSNILSDNSIIKVCQDFLVSHEICSFCTVWYQNPVCCWVSWPRPKVPKTKLPFLITMVIKSLNLAKKSISLQGSHQINFFKLVEIFIVKKVYHVKNPLDRWIFWPFQTSSTPYL